MLIPGTQMHVITFLFTCIEIVTFFYLRIYQLTRPDDKTVTLDLVLISLLIVFNVASGLLPDPNLPGNFFTQESIAYATGFIAPSYFPYYVLKAFNLEKMKFHAYRGVFIFLILPYTIFVMVLYLSGNLDTANYVLIIPVLYAPWVIYSLNKAVRYKYKNNFNNVESKEETAVMFLSLTPWVLEPVIVFLNLGQVVEATTTNLGFLLLFSLHVKRHIKALRREHLRLIESEQRLLQWNNDLQVEVEKRTSELKKINDQRTNAFVNLAHEIKTPITLINNYLEEFMIKNRSSNELKVVKKSLDKLSNDISNFFILERFNKGLAIYNHELITDFSQIVENSLLLFRQYANKRKIKIKETIENGILVKADPVSINQVVNNLVENAIKFSENDSLIEVLLYSRENVTHFSVVDYGTGIPIGMRKRVFEPYYQIANRKTSIQGMGLGLPIVKKIVVDLKGEIRIESNPTQSRGTKMLVILNRYALNENEVISSYTVNNKTITAIENLSIKVANHDENKRTILIAEDNIEMLNYLIFKLENRYNVYGALNGNEALNKLKTLPTLPHLIISDVMMDKVDGYTFAKIISNEPLYDHIPFIFLTAKSGKNDRIEGLKLGAIDFIQKPFSIYELLQKVESILLITGKQKKAILNSAFSVLSKDEIQYPASEDVKFEQNCKLHTLTPREIEIAKLICEGNTYDSIGNALFISRKTVAKHVQNIFSKVQVTNKIELVNKLNGS